MALQLLNSQTIDSLVTRVFNNRNLADLLPIAVDHCILSFIGAIDPLNSKTVRLVVGPICHDLATDGFVIQGKDFEAKALTLVVLVLTDIIKHAGVRVPGRGGILKYTVSVFLAIVPLAMIGLSILVGDYAKTLDQALLKLAFVFRSVRHKQLAWPVLHIVAPITLVDKPIVPVHCSKTTADMASPLAVVLVSVQIIVEALLAWTILLAVGLFGLRLGVLEVIPLFEESETVCSVGSPGLSALAVEALAQVVDLKEVRFHLMLFD